MQEFIADGARKVLDSHGRTRSVILNQYESKSEGGEVLMVYATQQGVAVLKTKTVMVLMVGYRNTSILV